MSGIDACIQHPPIPNHDPIVGGDAAMATAKRIRNVPLCPLCSGPMSARARRCMSCVSAASAARLAAPIRRCGGCLQDLPRSAFSTSVRCDRCRPCMTLYGKAHRATLSLEERRAEAHARRARQGERWMERYRTAARLSRQRYPKKRRAVKMLARALMRGVLQRQPCEVCGEAGSHGHHDDYDKPLEVRWLCPFHHVAHHVLHGKGLNGS